MLVEIFRFIPLETGIMLGIDGYHVTTRADINTVWEAHFSPASGATATSHAEFLEDMEKLGFKTSPVSKYVRAMHEPSYFDSNIKMMAL